MFEKDDFVQVEYVEKQKDGEIVSKWRNALYMGTHNGDHCVAYSSGAFEILHKGIKIRKAN